MFPQLGETLLSAFFRLRFIVLRNGHHFIRETERENIFLTLLPLQKKIYTIIIIREKFLASIISLYILCTFALFHSFQVNLTF